jgi:histidinol phosphatase-like PHP family hydrolase
MRITSDWHLHSRNSCDDACITVADLMAGTAALGVVDYGLTDHLHTPFNLPDIAASRAEYVAAAPGPRFHFGIEVSCVSQWEIEELARGLPRAKAPVYGIRAGGPAGAPPAIGITAEEVARFGIEYVIGGTHWPLYVPLEREAVIRDYHRQNLFLASHELVDIVAHPWWWMGHWKSPEGNYHNEPWFDDFGHIPESMHEEFAACARQHGAVVEINTGANLLNKRYPARFVRQYLEYLAGLKARGVALCLGSDCHSGAYAPRFEEVAPLLESVGIRDEELWRLAPRGARA